jgi:hypothetical protein
VAPLYSDNQHSAPNNHGKFFRRASALTCPCLPSCRQHASRPIPAPVNFTNTHCVAASSSATIHITRIALFATCAHAASVHPDGTRTPTPTCAFIFTFLALAPLSASSSDAKPVRFAPRSLHTTHTRINSLPSIHNRSPPPRVAAQLPLACVLKLRAWLQQQQFTRSQRGDDDTLPHGDGEAVHLAAAAGLTDVEAAARGALGDATPLTRSFRKMRFELDATKDRRCTSCLRHSCQNPVGS